MLERLVLGGLMSVVGAISTLQPPINAALARRTGPLPASTISFLVGTLILLALSLVLKPLLGGDFSAVRGAPWWQLTGGLIGALFVTSTIILVPRLGAAALVAGTIAGQLAGGVLIDYLGLFGLPRVPVAGSRLVGLVLLVVGGMLAVRR